MKYKNYKRSNSLKTWCQFNNTELLSEQDRVVVEISTPMPRVKKPRQKITSSSWRIFDARQGKIETATLIENPVFILRCRFADKTRFIELCRGTENPQQAEASKEAFCGSRVSRMIHPFGFKTWAAMKAAEGW